MKKRGKFIVFEGGEGSGKTTCIIFLKKKLAGRRFVFTREPGGTAIGDGIRRILMNPDYEEISSLAEFFLFCASRTQHVEEIIKPALKAGRHVISDRFDGSTIAYQLWGRKKLKFAETLLQLNSVAKQGLEPDLVIYLDVEPEVGLSRIKGPARNRLTRLDQEELEFHQRVRDGYLDQVKKSTLRSAGLKCLIPTPWYFINTTEKSAKEVKEEVWRIVRRYLRL